MSDEPKRLPFGGPPEERDQRLRWDALDIGTRWRIVRTIERGEAVEDPGEAELALWLARVRQRRGRPKVDLAFAFAYPVLGVVLVLIGAHPMVALFLVIAALLHFAHAQRWPRRARRLAEAERRNEEVVLRSRPPG